MRTGQCSGCGATFGDAIGSPPDWRIMRHDVVFDTDRGRRSTRRGFRAARAGETCATLSTSSRAGYAEYVEDVLVTS